MQQLLTRTQCSAMRGLAIIGIFLHNYCHWLGFAVKENEYTFSTVNCRGIMSALLSPDINLPVHLLSFFGHYGVPVFLFLSAYGLVMKYEKGGKRESSSFFIRQHYVKLFKMMIVGFVVFTMVDAVTSGSHHYSVVAVLGQLLMFNNLLPSPDAVIWPGPYWFFGLMLQLYIVYRLVLYRLKWPIIVALIVVCWLAQMFCEPDGDTLNRLRYNCIGGMLPFGAGILFARYGRDLSRRTWITVTTVSAAAVLFMSMNFQTWLWVPLFVCVFCVGVVKLVPEKMNVWMAWIGAISAALFVMHPVTRKIFIPVSRHGDIYTGLLLYIVASVAIAWFYHESKGLFGNRQSARKRGAADSVQGVNAHSDRQKEKLN